MIILEKPYVSPFLRETVARLKIPVLATTFSRSLPGAESMKFMDSGPFFSTLLGETHPLLYSNSENSIDYLNRFAPDLNFTSVVNQFKDKSVLRRIFSRLNPEVWYETHTLEGLDNLDVNSLPGPFVIKPVRGVASIGIHAIRDFRDWPEALAAIHREVRQIEGVFPGTVLNLDEFLIEQYIEGTEIAIDAYFDREGRPVILNILVHLFSSERDTSDRLYISSPEIILEYHDLIVRYLGEIAGLRDLRGFPFHLEMRQKTDGSIIPVEINPMRFMGFCVADIDYYFYGINPYEYYFLQKRPDWKSILESRQDKLYGMIVIDIPKHLDKSRISFNYEKFIARFSNPIHYVRMDYTIYPMAIFMFAETTRNGFAEFEAILHSDLTEFIDEDTNAINRTI
jgi:hypothetical protein